MRELARKSLGGVTGVGGLALAIYAGIHAYHDMDISQKSADAGNYQSAYHSEQDFARDNTAMLGGIVLAGGGIILLVDR